MTEAISPLRDPAQALKEKRLFQIAGTLIAGLFVAAVAYALERDWIVVYQLGAAMVMMLVCLVLGYRKHVPLANGVLLTSIMVMTASLMWTGEGLRDSTLLTFPVILIMAGMLVPVRTYVVLVLAMLTYLFAVTYATEVLGWRVDRTVGGYWGFMRDTMLVLVVSGFSVWVVVNDLQTALARLKEEIDKYRASQKHLTYLSQHDILTGLPNRALGRDRIGQAMGQAARHRQRMALLFVDLDNFKAINDSMGHAAGDEFLQQVAIRLGQSVRKSDIVARHGGDEFIIGLTDVANVQDVSTAAALVLARLSRPFMVRDTDISTSCSIGIALYPDDGADYEALLRQADIAMYQAKEAGRNAFRFYDEAMNASMQQDLLLVSNLRAALAQRQFVLHYQPVVDLVTGELRGAEALIRWQHPERGLVMPGQFISAAEKSGLIVDMGEWVLEEACRQMVAWQAGGCADFVMAVNLSTVQFRRGNVEGVVEVALKRSGLRPQCLELEITESTLIQDAETFMLSLQRIKALGVRISIDDFGTGYSNLSYLQRFAVDKLKIDQSFVMRLQQGPQERAIVNAIIQMAKSLDLQTTAEGIENEGVRQELIALGCTLGQGYHFARPLPAAEFQKLLRA